MADCHDQFLKFYDAIKISDAKLDNLRSSRNAIRDRIKKSFIDNNRKPIPEFKMQGSYVMNTIINPLDGEYDLDDGVYLKNLDTNDKSKWPTPDTVHKWIYDAVDGYTSDPPIDKRTCVRVVYAGEYHVDLPIYAEYLGNNLHAEKGERGWHESDPQALVKWFKTAIDQHGDQLRRMVRYFKAWADYNSKGGTLPCSLILTVLIVESYVAYERDDACFGQLSASIHERLLYSSSVPNPKDQSEDLYERYDESQKEYIVDTFKRLRSSARAALATESRKESCNKWRDEFGSRWVNCDLVKDEDKPRQSKAPSILKDDARSA
jgi:hypothetical protein